MAGLLAFMVMVSCSDGFRDCNLADKVSPYPTIAACEAQLDSNLRKAAQKNEYLLARCVPGQGLVPANDNPANDNKDSIAAHDNAANNAVFGEVVWQVSTHGDLLAKMKPAAGAFPAGGESGEGQNPADSSPLYAENTASSGAQNIENSPGLLAMAEQAASPENAEAAGHAGRQNSMMALYGKYKSKKAQSGKNRPVPQAVLDEAAAALAGYSPKYIYETNSLGSNIYYNNMDIVWGGMLPLSEAAFEIQYPAERIYALSPEIAAILRNPDMAEPALPTQDYFRREGDSFQRLFRQDMFAPNPAGGADSGGKDEQSRRKDGSEEEKSAYNSFRFIS